MTYLHSEFRRLAETRPADFIRLAAAAQYDRSLVYVNHPEDLREYGINPVGSLGALSHLPSQAVQTEIAAWPLALRLIARLRRPHDRGFGDTLAWLLGFAGGNILKAALAKPGKSCGCDNRQARLNQHFPYS